MIKGLDSLSNEQKELLFRVNENNTVCARLKNGNWYHYTQENTWF